MNRLLSITLVCLLQLSLAVASTFNLRLEVTPHGAGSLNTNGGTYEEGSIINLRAHINTGYVFKGWYEGETLLSSSTNFSYTMPSNDALVQARYEFDPAVPANPDSMATRYTVTVACKPVGGGSFNTTNATAEEGGNVNLHAYTNTGYRFLRWENEQGETISTVQNFYYIMPHGNSKVYGIFEFDPTVPSNPNKNYWNRDLGEVIVDDFTVGGLGNAVSSVISGSNRNDVAMITVAGRMNNNDFGIANDYTNCTLLDLSRVTGITEVPSYAFDYTHLESVYLPATIEKIGARAFYECKQLSSLIIYAMTPPTLENQVFTNVPDGLVVYVPAAAISQYQDADGWKDFTILSIQEDIRSISISMPEGTNAADYTQMWLELTNTKSGQRMHYVMTDRTQYTFSNIIYNTTWNVTLRNERGDVFGQIDNVEVKEEDVSVTFSSLSKPQNVTLSVLTPDGKNVTDQVQVTWTDAQGNYMAQGTSLSGLPVGYQVNYRMALSQELAMAYNAPLATGYTLKDGGNILTCQLQPIGQVQLTGKVKDGTTGLPLSGVVISASQTFGGKYSKTLIGKTDGKGVFTMEVSNAPTSVAFASTDYVSKTVDLTNNELNGFNEFSIPDVSLKPITGATISLEFTYTTCDGETQEWYSDYQNVSYELFNVTKNSVISQYNVQYPQIVLLEDVDDGDVLRLTATSRTNAFMPVQTAVTIIEQKAEATFEVVELGKIQSSFTSTGNASVVGSLYDASGKLLKTYNYSEASLTINDLADGSYTLVSMGSSHLFNTIYDLAQLPQTGLAENADYVLNQVQVKSGQVSTISINAVPTLDESKLYYTGDNTSFTVNKPSIVAGNYLTLTGHIDFKSAYATNVSNVQMIVDLPESCEFVENSVMVGNSTSSYTLNGSRITIPMARYTDRVRFCIIPTLGGEYAPSAFVQFDLNGETATQPIGSANYTAKDLSINVPSTVAKTTVPISGTAIGASVIEIYDNDVLIGQTTSLANGTWATTCELNEAYNLSTHSIYAKVTTKAGLELQSETVECQYDVNAIEVSKVTMYYSNPELHKDYELVYDFQNPSTTPHRYTYYIYNRLFTFTIDFTNNDTTKVRNVVLYVKTGDGNWHALDTQFDKDKEKWFASGEFGNMYDGIVPVNVSVDYDVESDFVFDTEHSNSLIQNAEAIRQEMQENTALDNYLDNIDESVSEGDIDLSLELVNEIFMLGGDTDIWEVANSLETEEKKRLEAEIELLSDSIFTAYNTMIESSIYANNILEEYLDGLTINQANNITAEELLLRGFELMQKTDGSVYYILFTENGWEFVDFNSNIYVIAGESSVLARAFASSDGEKTALVKFREICLKLEGIVTDIINTYEWIVKDLTNKDAVIKINLAIALGKWQEAQKNGAPVEVINALKANVNKSTLLLRTNNAIMKVIKKLGPWFGSSSKALLKGLSAVALLSDAWEGYNKAKNLLDLMESISAPCTEAMNAANDLLSETKTAFWLTVGYYIPKIGLDIGSLLGLSGGLVAIIPSGGTSFTVIAGAIAAIGINVLAGILFEWKYKKKYSNIIQRKNSLYKYCNWGSYAPYVLNTQDEGPGVPSGYHDNDVPIDPSGYVYEGVVSNRLQGVTATAYYKEIVEDMYGDLNETIVKWNAEEYAQENPLFTDENGMYRWDVPKGLWQVKFEKEGYETTYSKWLPVPPPQLDVNISMKQNVQPNVKIARAYEDAVELEFDRYMMPKLLTAENIMVITPSYSAEGGEKTVEGTIELLDEEVAYDGSSESFASKVRFNALEPFNATEVKLLVSNHVKSYAGIRMQDDYQQTFAVEQEIRQIVCDPLIAVGYGKTGTMTVSVLPASASKGKVLTVKTSSPMILSVESEQVTIGDDGKVEIAMMGELPGTAALTFSVEGTDKTAITIANVEQTAIKTVKTPTTNIASGTVVEKGTTITLSCATEGATIYYTLDGSCPCDNTIARKVYDGTPIVINDNTTIKAMAVATDMYESEVAVFSYIVNGTGIDEVTMNSLFEIFPLPVREKLNVTAGGKIIKNVVLSSINGVLVASSAKAATRVTLDVSKLPSGIYIINVTTEDGSHSRKVLKVQ